MSRRLAEVAKQVGVSEATVSRVLNEKPGVCDATRQAVLTALDVLGYERPTKLRGERARLVGLFLPELQNPIFPAFGELVGGALAQNGYTPVLCTQTAGGITEADYVDLLLQQQVSGVVFVGGQYTQEDASHDHYPRLAELKLPTVLVNAPVAELGVPDRLDRRRRRHEQAWNHLTQLGHTRIGLVLGPDDHVPSQRKLAAARRSSRAHGDALPTTHVVHSHYSLEAGQAAAARLLAAGRDGHHLRVRPDRARRDPRGAPRRAARAGGRLGRRLRRLGPDEQRRPAADDGPAADRADGAHGHRAARARRS